MRAISGFSKVLMPLLLLATLADSFVLFRVEPSDALVHVLNASRTNPGTVKNPEQVLNGRVQTLLVLFFTQPDIFAGPHALTSKRG